MPLSESPADLEVARRQSPRWKRGFTDYMSTGASVGNSRGFQVSMATAGISKTSRYPMVLQQKHLYLDFLHVNEQAWVYINGKLAFERSYASTGKGVGDLAGAAFSFDAKKWLVAGYQEQGSRQSHPYIGSGRHSATGNARRDRRRVLDRAAR